jgi:hypothetical protein
MVLLHIVNLFHLQVTNNLCITANDPVVYLTITFIQTIG